MTYRIIHWYTPSGQPGAEAFQIKNEQGWFVELEIENLHNFCKKNGPSILIPPKSKRNNSDRWLIMVTDETERFAQK